MAAEQNNDPLIRQLREQISDADRTIIEAVNVRLKLVSRLKDYKESRGISFVDPEREEWMLSYLTRARDRLNWEAISSSFSSSAASSIADSSITSAAAKIGASARTASAIASEGRESISISEPSCWTVMLA